MSVKTFLSYSHFAGQVLVKYFDSRFGLSVLCCGSSSYVMYHCPDVLIKTAYILDNSLVIEVYY